MKKPYEQRDIMDYLIRQFLLRNLYGNDVREKQVKIR